MGVDKFVQKEAMTNPDGSFKTQLRRPFWTPFSRLASTP